MQVILQRDVKNLGLAGEVVSVKQGYARNLLIPKKWAIPFTEGSAAERAHRKIVIAAKQKKALEHRQVLAKNLKDLKLSFIKEADTDGKLFGSLTVFEVSKELQAQGFEVDKRVIQLEQPLKQTGEYKVLVDFGFDIGAEITLTIVASVSRQTKQMDKLRKEAAKRIEVSKEDSTEETSTEETSTEEIPAEEIPAEETFSSGESKVSKEKITKDSTEETSTEEISAEETSSSGESKEN